MAFLLGDDENRHQPTAAYADPGQPRRGSATVF